MQSKKILILDVENQVSKVIKPLLTRFGYKTNHFVNGFEEAETLFKKIKFDLIICKISLPLEENILFLKQVLKDKETPVIYIVDQGKENFYKKDKLPNHYSFLIHPFDELTFRSVIEIYFKSLKENTPIDTLLIQKRNSNIEVPFEQMLWIKSERNYCLIYTDEKNHILRITIKKMIELLPQDQFIQVHRSSIINFRKIENLSIKDKNVIVGGFDIPIGRSYKKGLLVKLKVI